MNIPPGIGSVSVRLDPEAITWPGYSSASGLIPWKHALWVNGAAVCAECLADNQQGPPVGTSAGWGTLSGGKAFCVFVFFHRDPAPIQNL